MVIHRKAKPDFSVHLWKARGGLQPVFRLMWMGLILFMFIGSARTQPENAFTPKPCKLTLTDLVFWSYGLTDSDFFVFRKSGIYYLVTRMHAGYLLLDRGHWKLGRQGDVLMCSQQRFRPLPIREGAIEIDGRAFDMLHEDREGLEKFLSQTDKAICNHSELYEHWQYSYSGSLLPDTPRITRPQLEGVLDQLENYLTEANLFRATVWKCGNHIFMTGDARPLPTQEEAFQDACRSESRAVRIPYSLDEAEASDQMSRLQPFLTIAQPDFGEVRTKLQLPKRTPKVKLPACRSFSPGDDGSKLKSNDIEHQID